MKVDVKYRGRESDREAKGKRETLCSYDLVIELVAMAKKQC